MLGSWEQDTSISDPIEFGPPVAGRNSKGIEVKGLRKFTGRSTPVRYGGAVGSMALALLARMALHPLLGDQLPFVTFFAGIAAAAWLGGVGPSLLSAALGFALAELFFVHHTHQWWILTPLDLAIAASYFAVAATIVIVTRAIQHARAPGLISTERDLADRGDAEFGYRDVFEGALEGVYQTSIEGRSLAANPAVARILGYDSAQEFVSTVTDSAHQVWFDPNERSEFMRLLDAHESVCAYECQFKRKDGTAIWVSLNSRKVYGVDGQALYTVGFIEDITKRKQAEMSLRESEARLAEAQRVARVGSWSCDGQSHTATWSEEMYRITGRDPGCPAPGYAELETLYSPESWARINAAMQRALATGEPYALDLDIVRPDGGLRGVHCTGAAVRDEGGRVVRLHGTFQDITERKQAEAKLAEQAALLRHAHDAIWITDLKGNISFWNRGAEELYGWRPEQAVGANVNTLMKPEFPIPLVEIVALVVDRGQWEGEITHRTRSGRTVIVASRWTLQRADKTTPGKILEINRDITDRKRAEEELRLSNEARRESEERLRLAMTAAAETIWEFNPATGLMQRDETEGATFRYAPETASAAELWAVRVRSEDHERVSRSFFEALEGQAVSWRAEYKFLRADGEWSDIQDRAVIARDSSGKVIRVVGAMLDVTDLKRAEASLREANQRLHQLSRDLLRAQDYERRRIARELHDSTAQLLAALSINLSRLREPGLEPDRQRQVLAEAGELAAACSAEIRTVTCLLHPPLLEEVGLASALQSYAQGFNQRTGIQVEIKIPPDFGRLSSELEETLFRIVQEGLSNVQKHSGSQLAVVLLERDPQEVRLVLQDRGRGFPQALCGQTKGFVRFGIGIIGMRERAEQLGGRVELTSNDNGARLSVTLPLVHSNEEDTHPVGR